MSDKLATLSSTFETNESTLQNLKEDYKALIVFKDDLEMQFKEITVVKSELEEKCDVMKNSIEKYEKEVKQISEEKDVKLEEVNALKDIIQKMQVSLSAETSDTVDSVNLEQLLNVTQLKIDLTIAEKKNSNYDLQVKQLIEEKARLDEKFQQNEKLMIMYQKEAQEAVKEKKDAQNNLEVLSNYFNEREVKLQSELGLLQVKKEEEIKKNQSVNGYIKELEDKNESLKNQLESMRQELMQNESYLRCQMGMAEKKAHENWIAARNSRRELEESRKECEYLRQQFIARAKSANSDHFQSNDSFGSDTNSMSTLR